MKRFLLFLIFPFFLFLFANIQPASATTCCTNPFDSSTCFQVGNTCFADIDCPSDSYCDYGGAWCGWPFAGWPPALGGPCKPLDCKNCQVAQNHQCVSLAIPSWIPNCCSYSCMEGGFPNPYSPSLYDQKCYGWVNTQTDVNNCGSCGNKCASGQICKNGECKSQACKSCADGTRCGSCSSVNSGKRCVDVGGAGLLQVDTTCAPKQCTYTGNPTTDDASCPDSCETGGCNLRINVCTVGGTCGYSMTSKFCGIGNSCDKAVECYQSTGACGGGSSSGSGGSSWLYDGPLGRICSSGCPTSYPNQQYVACDAIGGCNPGTSGCGSYDPTVGETPCCFPGGFQACKKNEACKQTGCVDICTDPVTDRNAEPYCSKCNSCQDGIRNCGEPSVDKCEAFCMF